MTTENSKSEKIPIMIDNITINNRFELLTELWITNLSDTNSILIIKNMRASVFSQLNKTYRSSRYEIEIKLN